MKSADYFSPQNQFDIRGLKLFRMQPDGQEPAADKMLDIAPMMEELDIMEDILGSTLGAELLLADSFNLPDNFPIVGGEYIRVIYKTAGSDDEVQQDFRISKVGDRIASPDAKKGQMYWLYLCTPDRYLDANIDLSMAFEGTYTEIVKGCLGALASPKKVNFDQTDGIQKFIAPMWSPLRTAEWCASRAIDSHLSPFFLYETLDGYQLRSLYNLYQQESVKRLYIEPRNHRDNQEDPEKAFNTVLDVEYKASNDRLPQMADGLYGADIYTFNLKSKIIEKTSYSYSQMFQDNGVHLEKYPLVDDMADKRNKSLMMLAKYDSSHLGLFQRRVALGTMDNFRIMVRIPGDSSLRAGQVVDLDVPSRTGGVEYAAERTSSGRWFIASLRHILKRNAYSLVLELVKDSYKQDIASQIGVTANGSQ